MKKTIQYAVIYHDNIFASLEAAENSISNKEARKGYKIVQLGITIYTKEEWEVKRV